MIIIESIRIRNFRAIGELTFKPLEDGITGIFGSNGAGKTSILAATLYALYGIKPSGVPQSGLKRIGSDGLETSVSVLFKHMGQRVEVIREIKNARVIVNIWVDGVETTVTSVTAADEWIKKRLGVDSTGFLTAFVVRQKELDQLVNAKPAERKALIEKLAGIDTINTALKAAREEYNSLKKTVATIGGSKAEVDKAEADLEAATNSLAKQKEELEQISEKLNDAKAEYQKAKADFDAYRKVETALIENQAEQKAKKSAIQEFEKALQAEPFDGWESATLDGLRAEFNTLKSQAEILSNKINELDFAFRTAQSHESQVAKLTEQLEELSDAGLPQLEVLNKSLAELSESLENARTSIALHTQNIKNAEESIKDIEHANSCPTCRQDIKKPEVIISALKKEVESSNKAINESNESILKLNTDATLLHEQIKIAKARESIKQQLSDVTAKNTTSNSSVIADELAEVRAELESSETLKADVQDKGVKLKEYLKIKEDHATATQELDTLTASYSKLTKDLGKDAEKIEAKMNNKYGELELIRKDFDTITSAHQSSENAYSIAKNSYKYIKDEWDKRSAAADKLEISGHTVDMLDAFRANSISRLAPSLAETATELISEMTNGDFIEIKLDEEFTPSVVDSSGTERPVAWLSGGEESAVALALRIAIAFQITENQPTLLWLDEVLTAQDADRRSTVLSMIRRLSIKQIVMINHTQEASDIVDKAVTMIPDLENGSTMVEESQMEIPES